ncbi:hypothetical protein JKG68_09790 [Microvirga aerilata]|uniref:Anti-sigma factor NepR domain-containing protein n=1 Tax=Microvirga aerilata TaxID=670292 RepID=A0A936ZGS2_9HYPH|nr:hypothetical protein [Microvirga aerilata]MBL0404258.1 hypothetical protein [Microvirga aerilata]
MESEVGIGKRHPSVPDAELLRRIAHDMRSLYADVIRQPLPSNIEDALSRIDREQRGATCQRQQVGAESLG